MEVELGGWVEWVVGTPMNQVVASGGLIQVWLIRIPSSSGGAYDLPSFVDGTNDPKFG